MHQNPAALTLEHGATLPLTVQSRRVHLLGAVDLYTLALYTQHASVNVARLASPETAKALRIQVTFKEDLHRRIGIDWQELVFHLL